MASKSNLGLACVCAVAVASGAMGKPAEKATPAVQVHLEAARAAAAEFAAKMCDNALPANARSKPPGMDSLRDMDAIPGELQKPARAFDNLYYLGVRNVTSWAVVTSAGIILIDSLYTPGEAAGSIEAGLRSLGLDPAQIKYVLVTHAHGDHYGGARYLQNKYHARVLASEADWKSMAIGRDPDEPPLEGVHNYGPPPLQDMIVTDGQKLTLGGETLTLYITPGHTKGTVSVLIPVKDHGQPHLAALLGGTGDTFPSLYAVSVDRFMHIAAAEGADTLLSNHAEVDRVRMKIALLDKRGPGDPNPFVTGPDCVRSFLTQQAERAAAKAAAQTN